MANFNSIKKSKLGMPPSVADVKDNISQPEVAPSDGRNRKTGRTYQLSTRVHPDFYFRLREIAARDRLKMVEVLEEAMELYEQKKLDSESR
jgi:hypothetical protein